MAMNTRTKHIVKFVGVFIFLIFWVEYLTQSTLTALIVALVGALLSLRCGRKSIARRDHERVFTHFTAIHDGSDENLLSILYPDARRADGVFYHDDTAYAMRLTLDGTSNDEVLIIVQKVKDSAQKLVVYGNDVRADKIKPISPIPIEIRSVKVLIDELERAGYDVSVPTEFGRAVRGEKTPGKLLRVGYLLSSAVLMVISTPFSRIKPYMLICASVLVFLSLYVALKRDGNANSRYKKSRT